MGTKLHRPPITGWHLRLRQAREAAGLRQIDLASRIGVSTATLSDWEAGKIEDPKASNLLAISEALHVAPDAILYGRSVGLASILDASRPPDCVPSLPSDLSPELVRLWSELAPGQQTAFLATLRRQVRVNREVLSAFAAPDRGTRSA